MVLEIWDEAKLRLQFEGRLFVNTEGKHYKLWAIKSVGNNEYEVCWGRIGTKIQHIIIRGDYEYNRKIKEKLNKGYREV